MFFNIYTAKKNVFQALRLDSAITKYQTKLKEGMNINWEKPNLNKKPSVYYFINLINFYGFFFLFIFEFIAIILIIFIIVYFV